MWATQKKTAAQGQSHARATSAPVFKASANRMKGREKESSGNGGGFTGNCGLKLKTPLPLISSNRRACAAGLRPVGVQGPTGRV